MRKILGPAAVLGGLLWASGAYATPNVIITEFNSNSGIGNFEFVEFTNVGDTAQVMTDWSEDDSTRSPHKGQHVFSDFIGAFSLAPGESMIYTEATPDNFRNFWWGSTTGGPAGLKIIGPYSNDNLSSSGDEVNLYDNNNALIDRLTYNGSGTGPDGGGNASGITRNPSSLAVAMPDSITHKTNNIDWVNSFVGDSFGSFAAAGSSSLIGSPGTYIASVPEPTSVVLCLLGSGILGFTMLRNRRKR